MKYKDYLKSIAIDMNNPIRQLMIGGVPAFTPGLETERVGKTTVYIGHCSSMMAQYGLLMCGVIPMEMTDGSIHILLLTDDIFAELSPKSQKAMLEHEKAHILHGDTDRMFQFAKEHNNFKSRLLNTIRPGYLTEKCRVDDEELNADAYAADVCGTEAVINALRESEDVLPWQMRTSAIKKELKHRIRALQTRAYGSPMVTV